MNLKAIVALRNPGERYAQTRHNVGAWFLQKLMQNSEAMRRHKSIAVEYAKLSSGIICMQSTDYMNNSGVGIGALCRYYKIERSQVIVLHDDLDLKPGVVRLKFAGGDGGHNGIKSLMSHLQGKDFWRLRFGIGRSSMQEVSSYVLGLPSSDELAGIRQAIDIAAQNFDKLLLGDEQAFMREVHLTEEK